MTMMSSTIRSIHNSFRRLFNRITQNKVYNRYSTALDLEVNRIVWLDMEMTGLDVDRDKIMEIACLVTDSELQVIAEGPNIVIQQSTDVLSKMNDWCQKQHEKTGLVNLCLNSKIKVEEAEQMVLEFLQEHVTYKMSPVAGNSVYMDRMFLIKHMPNVHDYLHYRIIDVSTLKEICRRWNPELFKQAPTKNYDHRALQDIRESVEELLFYKKHFLKTIVER